MQHLIAFSHLRWNFVWQRPQHLLSRLARRWPLIFIEEPVPSSDRSYLEQVAPCPGVQVWRPHVTGATPGFSDDHLPQLKPMITGAVTQAKVSQAWHWFYTPMALPLAADLPAHGVVYDCMDELSAFRFAPRQLVQRENALFKAADLVFTGGLSLFHAKRERHPSVHCFPSSVDARHFAQAAQDHPSQKHLARPRLGWCGVIDERVDLALLAALADARPDWQFVMVGPIVKIDPGSVPRRPNIHWLGQRAYDELPEFISGWDVCLLPFAINDATRYISPTKTLEYMACGRPSVSTPIRDVVEPYQHLVSIAPTPEDFLLACESILARTESERACHAQAMAEVVAGTSWEDTARQMAHLMDAVDPVEQPLAGIRQSSDPEVPKRAATG